jgi:glycosyltransferase involved in cell wall biosynthesis
VISAHQRPNLIADTIRSVLAQTEPIREIIVVTDVESPETETIVHDLAASSHIPIRWVDRSDDRSPGISGSRNRGADQATGTWVAQLDDDVEWLPTLAS